MKNSVNNFIYRRHIIKSVGILLVLLPLKILYSMLKYKLSYIRNNYKPIKINLDQLNEVSFKEELIIVRKNDDYSVFSARCSHLGCIINKIKGDELICPCHGSRFSLNGDVLEGPASKKLARLNFNIDHNNGILIVEPFV